MLFEVSNIPRIRYKLFELNKVSILQKDFNENTDKYHLGFIF